MLPETAVFLFAYIFDVHLFSAKRRKKVTSSFPPPSGGKTLLFAHLLNTDENNSQYHMANIDRVIKELRTHGFKDAAKFLEEKIT